MPEPVKHVFTATKQLRWVQWNPTTGSSIDVVFNSPLHGVCKLQQMWTNEVGYSEWRDVPFSSGAS